MFVSEIYDESKIVLGRCDQNVVFKRISDAVKLANNQGKFDATLGIIDLWVTNGFITLPPEVYTILGVNHDGWPTLIRDQWYQFHVNGTGLERWQPWTFTDELGPVCTFNDPQVPCAISAIVEQAVDSNCLVRVFGWDLSGKRIYTPDPVTGDLVDGFLVPTTYGYQTSNPDQPPIARIDRVQKAATQGYVQLFASDPNNVQPTIMIGYYQPWETVPAYRRIRVPNCLWVRIKSKRKDRTGEELRDGGHATVKQRGRFSSSSRPQCPAGDLFRRN